MDNVNKGIILLDKDTGTTSRNCDNRIGRIFETRHVGHSGTLDPFATGLLIVGIDQGCKSLPYIDTSRKTYVAELKFGIATSTGDLTGEIKEERDIPNDLYAKIPSILSSFVGKSHQIPPMTSAIKINGVALYKLAHKGEEIERQEREIEVYSLNIISLKDNILTFETEVSEGTYIRVLGEDIAKRAGTVGHLISLRRTKIGSIDLSKAKRLEELDSNSALDPAPFIPFPKIEMQDDQVKKVKDGRTVNLTTEEEKILLTYGGQALAIYKRKEDNIFTCERGLF